MLPYAGVVNEASIVNANGINRLEKKSSRPARIWITMRSYLVVKRGGL